MKLFTINQSSKILGLSRDTVRRYNAIGLLPTVARDERRRNLISLETLQAYHQKRMINKKFDLLVVVECDNQQQQQKKERKL